MKKLILLVMIFTLRSAPSFSASIDDRLVELIQRKAELQSVGKDLDSKDSDEFAKLAGQKGIVGTAELQAQVRSEKQASAPAASTQTPPGVQASLLATGATPEQKQNQSQAYAKYLARNPEAAKAVASRPTPNPNQFPAVIDKSRVELKDANLPGTNEGASDFTEQKSLGADSVNLTRTAPKVSKSLPKKKNLPVAETVDPSYRSRLKSEMTEIDSAKEQFAVEVAPIKPHTTSALKQSGSEIYQPEPKPEQSKDFVVDRDSKSIVTKSVGLNDALTVKMCINYGVSVIFDKSIETSIQRVVKDDNIFFDAQEFENKRGVYIHLLKPLPAGMRWESAVRLIRQSDDRTYLVNLVGVSCPDGNIDYPKIVYIKEKTDIFTSMGSMPPEDMIIEVSQGLPRKNLNKVKVYDMIASPGSPWVIFGVEITEASISHPEKIEFAALDNLQIQKLAVKATFMKLQSDRATQLRGGEVSYRFKVMVNIDKNYITHNRYLHLVYINKETKHYQYIEIDALDYFNKLKLRGFDL